MADDIEAKRQTAAYNNKVSFLRNAHPEMSAEAMDEAGLREVDIAVYGFDAKKDRKGHFIPQGIGSAGHESGNHFAAIRRYQGEEAWKEAVREIWGRDPKHAEKLGLPQPART